MVKSLTENIVRIKELLYINEQQGSAPCKQPNQMKTTSGETELMGYILNVLDDNNINLKNCKDKACFDNIVKAETQIKDLLNALVDKRDNGTQLPTNIQAYFKFYEQRMRGQFKDFNTYHYNRGTCAGKSQVTYKSTTILKK